MGRTMSKLLGPAYPFYIKARTSEPVRALAAATGAPAYWRSRRAHPGMLAVDVDGRRGMGAVIANVLLLHALAEDEGLAPAIVSTNPLYTRRGAGDFLREYFERPAAPGGVPPVRGNATSWVEREVAPRHIPFERAAALFARHFAPGAAVREAVAATLGARDGFDLSVHFRGTDKVFESGRLDAPAMLEALDEAIGAGGREVFLATDESAFEAAVRKRFPRCRFTTYNLGEVSVGVPRHFSPLDPATKALEAIGNIFLLAAAPLCLRTSSYLSAISALANPAMATRTINRTLDGSSLFPEREVIAREEARARALPGRAG